MKKNLLQRPMLAVLLTAGVVSITQGDARPQSVSNRVLEVRFVPLVRDGRLVGLKVFAIRDGSRYERAALRNGDTIEAIDGAWVLHHTDAAKLTDARRDVSVRVRRPGTPETLDLTIPADR